MGIGAMSPLWRRALFRAFSSLYFRRRIKAEGGTFDVIVSPGCALQFLDPRKSLIDPVHRRFIHDWIHTDDIVWDIGANLGLFAFPAALKARHVYAFEADIDLVIAMRRSISLNRLPVSIVNGAVSNCDGEANFEISRYGRAMNRLEGIGKWHDDMIVKSELRRVPTFKLDTMARSVAAPDVMKIDVEGAEFDVLTGASDVIKNHRPVILIEVAHDIRHDVRHFFEHHGYELFDGGNDPPNHIDEPVFDTIAVPRGALDNAASDYDGPGILE
jgi:FkbM family methyltransferase